MQYRRVAEGPAQVAHGLLDPVGVDEPRHHMGGADQTGPHRLAYDPVAPLPAASTVLVDSRNPHDLGPP
ncbi:hypothetical protein GCM10010376_89390 [Streptomyces violaceusniger]